jgi:precorrin-8X/cobalt-precorrin-8 methylmutase
MTYAYERDGAAIYRQSFSTIRAEADLAQFPEVEALVAVRIIHACGMTEIARDLHFAPGFTKAARVALLAGKPIFCDSQMVAHGITHARLPAGNEVVCTLDASETPALAARLATTRSAAALELWGERVEGALIAMGNAPTALFHLLEKLETGAPAPAAIIGMPVGFVGAAEAKQALANFARVPFLIVHGRLGRQRHGRCRCQRPCAGRGMTAMPGTLHVIGVGPGDPELMTLKAARAIAASKVIAYFAKRGEHGHARRTADA